MEIKTTEIQSYVVTVTSQNEAVYTTQADVSVAKGTVTNFSSGNITRVSDKVVVASFNNVGNLSVSYSTTDEAEQKTILDNINAFMESCKTNVQTLL